MVTKSASTPGVLVYLLAAEQTGGNAGLARSLHFHEPREAVGLNHRYVCGGVGERELTDTVGPLSLSATSTSEPRAPQHRARDRPVRSDWRVTASGRHLRPPPPDPWWTAPCCAERERRRSSSSSNLKEKVAVDERGGGGLSATLAGGRTCNRAAFHFPPHVD